jgi:hypothetical protein
MEQSDRPVLSTHWLAGPLLVETIAANEYPENPAF